MKGIIIQEGKEVNCELIGESWKQGDTIKGTLNSSGLENIKVKLALVNNKKLKAKDEKAFNFLSEHSISSGENLNFELNINSPISEKKESFYILFGDESEIWKMGLLQLEVTPSQKILNFLNILDTFMRFKTKELKNDKDGFICAVLTPPSTKEHSVIDSLNLFLKLEEKDLHLKFSFKINKIDYNDPKLKMKKVKFDQDLVLTPKEYVMFRDDLDQDKVIKVLEAVIDEAKKQKAF